MSQYFLCVYIYIFSNLIEISNNALNNSRIGPNLIQEFIRICMCLFVCVCLYAWTWTCVYMCLSLRRNILELHATKNIKTLWKDLDEESKVLVSLVFNLIKISLLSCRPPPTAIDQFMRKSKFTSQLKFFVNRKFQVGRISSVIILISMQYFSCIYIFSNLIEISKSCGKQFSF